MLMIEGLDPSTLLVALEDPHYDASRSVERERDDVPASSTPEGGPLQDEEVRPADNSPHDAATVPMEDPRDDVDESSVALEDPAADVPAVVGPAAPARGRGRGTGRGRGRPRVNLAPRGQHGGYRHGVPGGAARPVPEYLVRSEVPGRQERTIADHELVSQAMHRGKKRKLAEVDLAQRQGDLQIAQREVDKHASRYGELTKKGKTKIKKPVDVSPSTQLRIAFPAGPLLPDSVVGQAERMHKATVSRIRIKCAEIFMRKQDNMKVQLVDMLSRRKACVFVDKVKWDETRHAVTQSIPMSALGAGESPQLLAITDGKASGRGRGRLFRGRGRGRRGGGRGSLAKSRMRGPKRTVQRKGSTLRMWKASDNVMVQLRQMWVWESAGSAGRVAPVVVPCNMLPSNSADNINKNLRFHDIAPREKLADCTKFLLEIRESDAHSSNLAVIKRETKHQPSNAVTLHMLCKVHQLYPSWLRVAYDMSYAAHMRTVADICRDICAPNSFNIEPN